MQAASEAEGKIAEDFSPLAMFAFFVNRVKENLHIIIAFSPIGDAFRNRMRQFPSLINCCTIDWFQVCMKETIFFYIFSADGSFSKMFSKHFVLLVDSKKKKVSWSQSRKIDANMRQSIPEKAYFKISFAREPYFFLSISFNTVLNS